MRSRSAVFTLQAVTLLLLACSTPRRAQAPVPPALPVALPPAQPPAVPPVQATPPPPDSVFASSIKPMLATSCAPCHIPGGKMYDRMPFDDPAVVRSHSGGIVKRLKDEKRLAFESWLSSSR